MTAIMIGPSLGLPNKVGMIPARGEPSHQLTTTTIRPRILLVEDEFEMRRLLAEVLRKEGYDVTEAENGAEGVDHVLDSWRCGGSMEPFDLVISDVRMPGWTGLEIVEIVATSGLATPVILITAFGTAETHAEARRLGAVKIFDKPFELNSLVAAVREVVLGNDLNPPRRAELSGPLGAKS
jgi:DNA-binding response OmpR family regulator